MRVQDLIGQAHARAALQGALRSGRIAHAYLFAGPRGVGRRTAARAFAQALLCVAGTEEACEACAACRKVAAGTHPDVRILQAGRTEAGAERRAVAIDQVRDLKRDAAYPPYEGRWKIFIVQDTEQMRAEAANSFLKLLEEPSPHTVIILLAESTEALLPTIVSRVQLVRFSPLAAEAIAAALTARGVPPDRARVAAALSGGRVADALAAAAGDEAAARREEVLRTLRALQGGLGACFDAAEAFARQKEDLERRLDIALLWYRDLTVWRTGADPDLLVNVDRRAEVADLAAHATEEALAAAVLAIERAKEALRRNVNPRLVLELLFARIARTLDRRAA